jgi:hypothetical protein
MANIELLNYSVLRCGGASHARACAEMGVNSGRAIELAAGFRMRRSEDPRPRFARDDRHVADVLAAGGYPALDR